MDEPEEQYLQFLQEFNERFHQRLGAYFLASRLEADEAEELCSEVYMTAFLKIQNQNLILKESTFEDFSKYLWGIARNIKKAFYRTRANQSIINIDAIGDLADRQDDSLAEDMQAFMTHLEEAILNLSESQRNIASLYFLSEEKMTRREISNILGLNPDAVSKSIFRIKANLREALGDYKQTYIDWLNQS